MFAHVSEAPVDPILGTAIAFKADTNPKKVNLGIGANRNEAGEPVVFQSVRKVEVEHAADAKCFKEYAPIDGDARLKGLTQELAFGDDSPALAEGRIASCQGLSGTGSLRVAGEFIKKHMPEAAHTIYLSNPTWGNHDAIFANAGMVVRKYPYWDAEGRRLDFDGMIACLQGAPSGSSVLLHAVAHNPTGMDPTPQQWQEIMSLVQARQLVLILDSAYQGFASGDLQKDRYAVELFDRAGIEFILCQSFAKNMGLYGERIGMVHAVCATPQAATCVLSQLKLVVRPMYSSPPIHGAELVIRMLGDAANREAWEQELKTTAERISKMRGLLVKGLKAKGTPGTWDHISQQIGMFSFTGLAPAQCAILIDKYSIYLLKSGRISLAGLNESNVQYVVDAIDDAVRSSRGQKRRMS